MEWQENKVDVRFVHLQLHRTNSFRDAYFWWLSLSTVGNCVVWCGGISAGNMSGVMLHLIILHKPSRNSWGSSRQSYKSKREISGNCRSCHTILMKFGQFHDSPKYSARGAMIQNARWIFSTSFRQRFFLLFLMHLCTLTNGDMCNVKWFERQDFLFPTWDKTAINVNQVLPLGHLEWVFATFCVSCRPSLCPRPVYRLEEEGQNTKGVISLKNILCSVTIETCLLKFNCGCVECYRQTRRLYDNLCFRVLSFILSPWNAMLTSRILTARRLFTLTLECFTES